VFVAPTNPQARAAATRIRIGGVIREGARVVTLDITVEDSRRSGHPTTARQSFRADLDDFLELQPEISRFIVSALRVRAADSPGTSWRAKPARDLYVAGRYLWLQHDPKQLDAAIRALRASTGLNSSNAEAWATLSRAYLDKSYSMQTGDLSMAAAARDAARRALRANPESAAAHAAQAEVLLKIDGDQDGASRELAVALRDDPDDQDARQFAAELAAAQRP
jgi:tetratricopeptide (TPR) repeat protein